MFNTKLFRKAFLLLVIISILYYIAEVFYLHWTVWWYDVILHFISGACAAMAFMHFYFGYFEFSKPNKKIAVALTTLFVLFVGVTWEIYELKWGLTFLSDGIFYLRDTTSDIIIDLCGGFFGTLYSFKLLKGFDDII